MSAVLFGWGEAWREVWGEPRGIGGEPCTELVWGEADWVLPLSNGSKSSFSSKLKLLESVLGLGELFSIVTVILGGGLLGC